MIVQRLLIFCTLICFFSCSNDLEEISRVSNDKVLPVSTSKNVEMLYSDSARMKARIKAPLRETYIGDKGYIEFRKGIKVEFFGNNGKVESQLTSEYAVSRTRENRTEAKNNVVLSNAAGDRLNTEHLIWDQKEDRIYSNVFTRITSPERVIYGEGFESNQDFSKYRILKIKGNISFKE